ncbi:protein-L-isoaspartate O-methyltransferase family protein [Undibacterium sp. Ren11W]|uniref:protein-L-isoaspartate O-methyltransferase family protein n=1 Tax=Undibacterium sp. Ren11W TaxID=3413045 RepID=UPI003BF3DDDC
MNIEKARFNMIEQQIRPWNVSSPEVLALLAAVKREDYFPEDQKSLAFFDTELPLPGGTVALSPKLEARILQDLAVKKSENVLVVGAGSGYLAALLAHQARQVTVVEAIPELKTLAETNLQNQGIFNVDVVWGDALLGKTGSSFDAIVVCGSLEVIPELLKNQLTAGGRMFVFIGKAPVMTAQMISRESELFFNTKNLFETLVPALSQSVPESRFTF